MQSILNPALSSTLVSCMQVLYVAIVSHAVHATRVRLTCIDSYPACPGWGASSCIYPGVPEQCPCMCGGNLSGFPPSLPSPSPSPPEPSPDLKPNPSPPLCVDTYAACAGWGKDSCIYGGVAEQCPCMCVTGTGISPSSNSSPSPSPKPNPSPNPSPNLGKSDIM